MNLFKIVYQLILIVTIVTISGCQKTITLDTEHLSLKLKTNGKITGLQDKKGKINYLAEEIPSSLLSIRIDGKFYEPASLSFSDDIFLLKYVESGITAKIKAEIKKSYLTFKLLELSDTVKVDLILWGPFKTSIRETVGETIGVVRDSAFAIGIQSLNPRTLGGIGNGDHDFSVDCRFPSDNKGILKLEIKTAGDPEIVGAEVR